MSALGRVIDKAITFLARVILYNKPLSETDRYGTLLTPKEEEEAVCSEIHHYQSGWE